jgi:hypothetical protein
MNTSNLPGSSLEDSTVDTKIKLAALWASAMFCYIYGDYFELYIPGKLAGMLEGKIQPLGPVTQGVLLGTSVMMAVPSVMVFLSLVMKPRINRWANIIFGAIYTLIMLLVIQGTWTFYRFFGIVEILLTSTIVWQAWKWPRNA